MLAQKLISGSGEDKIWADDCFAVHTYTGNGSTQTITNGIDLAGKGGLVITKTRNGANDWAFTDTLRGVNYKLASNNTAAQNATYTNRLTAFNSDGFTLGADTSGGEYNQSGYTYASWTFRKAPKFFDVVTYTGDGSGNRVISHSLAQDVGMIIVKTTSAVDNWYAWHRSLPNSATGYLKLNTTDSHLASGTSWFTSTSTNFTIVDNSANSNGVSYVAYLFAHDTSTDGIIQCGSFTNSGSDVSINLGYEQQYLMVKNASVAGGNWNIWDSMRGLFVGAADSRLYANLSNAETTSDQVEPNAQGFTIKGAAIGNGDYIYLAIRRPNKPPTSGTQVYNAIARTGTGAAATVTGVGFAPDLVMSRSRAGTYNARWFDRLRGAKVGLDTNGTGAEVTEATTLTGFDVMDGITVGSDADRVINTSNATYNQIINHFFRRAVGCFDQVCYTGTGAAHTEAHSLGVVPELMIVKRRSAGTVSWYVYNQTIGATKYLRLDTTDAIQAWSDTDNFNGTTPTASVFSLGSGAFTNNSGSTYSCWMFATKAGISYCGSVIKSSGANLNVDCGFTTGSRFVLLKRTDSTGDWYCWDSIRGVVSGNDPYLLLNSTAAENTSTDYIDPHTAGFTIVDGGLANGTYIVLSFA